MATRRDAWAAVIGCGKIGSEFADDPRVSGVYSHTGANVSCQATDLVAVCDSDAGKLQACVARWGVGAGYRDARMLLMIDLYGYETAAQQRTFDTYNDVDCFHYSGLHDEVKVFKWEYGKVADHPSREIWLKRLTREEGIETGRD